MQQVKSSKSRSVTVIAGDHGKGIHQPDTFRVCPLGIQFYSKKKFPEFELIEFNISIPGKNGATEDITCTGVVVHCQPDKQTSLNRVWIKFIDLPDEKRNRIKCVAKTSSFLCPYCENF